MRESRNIYDLLSKIDWEGGITEVLDYGIRDIEEYDVSDDLKEAWEDMEDFYTDFENALAKVYDLMRAEEREFDERKGL